MKEQKIFIRLFLILFFTIFIVFSILSLILNIKMSPTGLVLCGGASCHVGASLTVVGEETPQASSGGNGGGGGSTTQEIVIKTQDIYVDKTQLEVSPIQGEIKQETITITNPGNKEVKINIQPENIPKFVSFSENEFTLKLGQSKSITMILRTSEDESLFNYKGNLSIIVNGVLTKLIPIEIRVLPKEQPLYDVVLEMPFEYEEVTVGEKLFTAVKLSRVKGIGNINANLAYVIKDENQNIVYREEETIIIEEQTSFIKKIEIPEELKTGKYYLTTMASYNNVAIGAGIVSFKVIEKKNIEEPSKIQYLLSQKDLYWVGLLGFIFLAGILILLVEIVKLERIKNKKIIENMVKEGEKKDKNKIIPYFKDDNDNNKVKPYFK